MNWLSKELYPFESKHIQLDAGKMHYIDEGEGEVILMVHGTPTWSFLYRDYVKSLSKSHRCIAVDHLGFGLSEKNKDFEGSPQWHARNLEEFITKLDLKDITIVVHDFGGPIGLGAAIAQPDRIKRVILHNTFLWETASSKGVQKIDKLIRSGLGKFLYLNLNFVPKVIFKKAFYKKEALTKEIHKHYIKPFPTVSSRWGMLKIARSLVGSSDWYQQQWENLDVLKDKPWVIIWALKDPVIVPKFLQKWKERIPKAEIHELECGHFLQEESPDDIIDLIKEHI